MENAPVALAG